MTNEIETQVLCSYGCGKIAKHILKNGKPCCSQYSTQCEAVKTKNKKGLKQAYSTGKRESGAELYQNMDHGAKDRMAWRRGRDIVSDKRLSITKDTDKLFTENSQYRGIHIKRYIIKYNLLEYKCQWCGLTNEWHGRPLSLELDHINGIGNDNRLENLRFLCHNCHSQTDTFQGRNRNKNIIPIPDEKLIEVIIDNYTINEVLYKLGLSTGSGNFKRVYNIMATHGLKFKEKGGS